MAHAVTAMIILWINAVLRPIRNSNVRIIVVNVNFNKLGVSSVFISIYLVGYLCLQSRRV